MWWPFPAMINGPLSAASLVFPIPEALMRKEDSLSCDHSQKDWWPGQAQLGTLSLAPLSLRPSKNGREPKGSEGAREPLRVSQQVCSKAP